MLGKSISRNSILLSLFAAFTTAAIAGTYLFTKGHIAEQERQAAHRALLEIFPKQTHDNNLLDDFLTLGNNKQLNVTYPHKVFVAKKNNLVQGFIFLAIAPDGYAGSIHLLIGIKTNGDIAGVRVVKHQETPGLGDAIETRKSDWILNFNNKSLTQPTANLWKVKKDKGAFDQFTGATITPRAVTTTVLNSLLFFQQQKDILINQAATNITQKRAH